MIFWSLGNNDSRSFFLIKFELDVQIQEVNPKMANKAELISEVAANTKLTKKQAAVAIDAIFSSIQNDLANGNKVHLVLLKFVTVLHVRVATLKLVLKLKFLQVKFLHLSQERHLRMLLSRAVFIILLRRLILEKQVTKKLLVFYFLKNKFTELLLYRIY